MSTTPNLGLTQLEIGQAEKEATINANNLIIDGQLGGEPSLTFIGCRVYGSANQSITTATLTALSFNTERYDTDVMHDTSTNPSRLIAKTAGKYSIKASVGFAAHATGWRGTWIRINGATYIAGDRDNTIGGADATYMTISGDYNMAVNDYAEIMVEHTAGVSINVIANANVSYEAMMHLIR
jgi:hypothetical protein